MKPKNANEIDLMDDSVHLTSQTIVFVLAGEFLAFKSFEDNLD